MLVFIETESQLHHVAQEYPGTQIVVMTSGAEYAAQNLKIDVISIEDLCNEAELLPISEEIINTVEDLCDYVDQKSQTIIKSRYANRILSLRAYFHFIKQNIDSFVIRVEQIARTIEALSPDSILILPAPAQNSPNGITVLDKPVLGLSTQLVPLVARNSGIDFVRLEPELPKDNSKNNNGTTFDGNHYSSSDSNTQRSTWLKFIYFRQLLFNFFMQRRAPKFKSDKPILLHSLFADLGSSIIDDWEASGGLSCSITDWLDYFGSSTPTRQMQEQCRLLWLDLSKDRKFHEYFSYRGLDLWDKFESILQKIFCLHYPLLLSEINRAKKAFKKGPIAIISGGMVGPNYIYGKICQVHKKPFFSHHYTGFVGVSILPTHERYDFAECDYFICGGPGAKEALREPSPESRWRRGTKRAQPIPTGLPWLKEDMDKYRQPRIFSSKKVKRIMVVLSALLGDCRFLGYVFTPEIESSRFMLRVVKRLLEEEIEIVIKQPLSKRYPQQTHPVVDWLKLKNFSNVAFADDVELMQCINSADAFITESPSTPLLKLAATRLPILLSVDRKHYLLDSRAKELLKRRCTVFAEDIESFMLGLEEFLNVHIRNGEPVSGEVDDTFLYEFGLGSNDLPSENIVKFIRNKINAN